MPEDTLLISSISAKNLVVKDIFCDNFLFTIPNYQRHYSWEEEHSIQLLEDIDSFAFRDENFDTLPPYFLGSAVVIKQDNQTSAQIVDGQQRLTTLTILLSCLRYSIEDEKNKKTLSGLIFQRGDELLGTSETFRLKTRKGDQEFFNAFIQDPDGLQRHFKNSEKTTWANDAQWQMLTNAEAFIKHFEKKQYSQEKLKHIAKYIIQKCVLVIVASTDEDMAFRIFNVLNDRGKDLTIADILKSEVIEKVPKNEQDKYADKWEDCETKLGADNFRDFFSYLRTIYAQKKAEKSIINEIREYIRPSEKPKEFIDEILIPFTNAYHSIIKEAYASQSHAEGINELFSKLKRFSHRDWLPSAILFVAKHPNSSKAIYEFLIQLEKTTLGMDAGRHTLNERIERYARINAAISNNQDLFTYNTSFLLNEYDLQRIVDSLGASDLYGKRLLKPVLARIEESMSDNSIKLNFEALNIEHILPQSPSSEYWISRFTKEQMQQQTNCLGNLTLINTRKNAQAQNHAFPHKVEVYFTADGRASNLSMTNELKKIEHWTPEAIDQRHARLLQIFLNSIDFEIEVQ